MANTMIESTVARYPRLPYDAIKDGVLGKAYELSLTFVGERRAQQLNKTYRKKTYAPNVLSFPLDDRHGEIYICPRRAQVEAKQFSLTPTQYIGFLFIHGCLHLKGHDHGATMEKTEQRLLHKFILGS